MDENKKFGWLLWNGIYPWLVYLLISFIISFVLAFTAGLASGMTDINLRETAWFIHNVPLMTASISAAVSIPILFRMFHSDQLQRGILPPVQKLAGRKRYLLVLGFSACIAGNNLIKISRLGYWFPGYQEISASMDLSWLWLNFAGAGILVPVAEELVFRALLFGRIRDRYSFWTAAILSCAAFGAFHGNVVQGIYAAFLGMVLAYGYEQCQSLLAPVLLHISMNLTSILFNRMIPEYSFMKPGFLFYVGTLVSLIICAFCMARIKNSSIERKILDET